MFSVAPTPARSLHQSAQKFQLAALLLFLIPIGLVGWVVLTYAVNLPYWDDFIVQEHLLMLKNSSGSQKLRHFFDQHWEHRIVWTRFVFALFAKINGTLNYYGLTVIGVSGLLALLGVLFAFFRKLSLPLIYFTPVCFFLFTFQSYENLIWAMASIQNFWILVFSLCAFYSLAQNTTVARLLAIGLAVLATYTSGNGALVFIAGAIVLVYQRQWRFIVAWVVVMAVALAGYFYTYHRISFFPSPFRYPVTDWIKAFFVFLGAFADPSPNAGTSPLGPDATLWITILVGFLVASLVGIFLLSVFQQFVRSTNDKVSSFLLGCFLFLFATAAITVYSRVGFAGPGYLLQGRYKIYSALALSLVYLYSLHRWQTRSFLSRYVAAIIVISIGQSLVSDYLCLEGIINQHRRTVAEYFNYVANTPTDRQQAIRQVYIPTERPFFSDQIRQLSAPEWLSASATTNTDRVDDQAFMYNIPKADAPNPTVERPDNGSYIYFKSLSNTYLFAARPLRNSSTGFGPYFDPQGVYGQVLKEKLAPGKYRIGVLTNQNNQIRLAMTNRYVTFTSL